MCIRDRNGPLVFKTAVIKFQEVIQEALQKAGLTSKDINMLIPHQANLRISQFIQQKLELRDDQVWNNIQKYGCLLYTSPSPRDRTRYRMPSSA